MRSQLLTVVAGSASDGRCRYCRSPIVWATVVTHAGVRQLPFTNAPIVRQPFQDARGVRYERWAGDLLHLNRCTKQPAGRSAHV